ncbi:cysteine hydrolase family protein [Candidimonas nitroreducens]|uniref:Isochorismatase n=1 Tax=Candidimonas nitroreducens TaxID=683354 RepID=A0A225M7S2_9BURK|nr:isochorismatase family cysteine hydrolase [Candidimonas nitroreducens]OWT57384.1 isochorismatase [Candidimonas nitroreducens]
MSSPRNIALLLIDFQNDMVHPAGKIGANGLAACVSARDILSRTRSVADVFRNYGLPVIFVRLAFQAEYVDSLSVAPRIAKLKAAGAALIDTWGAAIHEDLQPRAGDLVFNKQCVNPFFNTPLLSWLGRHNIRELAIAGVATNLAVESAVRYADDAGIAPIVLEDCCASVNDEMHQLSVTRILPIFGSVESSEKCIDRLSKMGTTQV